jgi:hypothetical protein
MRSSTTALLGLAMLVACREDPGEADYTTHLGVRDRFDCDLTLLPGPNPFQPGDTRASLGVFYEGAASEVFEFGPNQQYFVFEESFNQLPSCERIEGILSDEIILNGSFFWGGGIFFQDEEENLMPADLSIYDSLRVSLRSGDPAFEVVEFTMFSNGTSGVRVDARDYGYRNDDNWYNLDIPLADFEIDLTQVTSPLVFGGPGIAVGESLLIDDLYFEAKPPE